MTHAMDEAARKLDALATELNAAVTHAQTAARHFRDREVPRAAAHQFALFGHLTKARLALEELAQEHASRSKPLPLE
jgi:hypothetical protein